MMQVLHIYRENKSNHFGHRWLGAKSAPSILWPWYHNISMHAINNWYILNFVMVRVTYICKKKWKQSLSIYCYRWLGAKVCSEQFVAMTSVGMQSSNRYISSWMYHGAGLAYIYKKKWKLSLWSQMARRQVCAKQSVAVTSVGMQSNNRYISSWCIMVRVSHIYKKNESYHFRSQMARRQVCAEQSEAMTSVGMQSIIDIFEFSSWYTMVRVPYICQEKWKRSSWSQVAWRQVCSEQTVAMTSLISRHAIKSRYISSWCIMVRVLYICWTI